MSRLKRFFRWVFCLGRKPEPTPTPEPKSEDRP